jgi:hypothetical protein
MLIGIRDVSPARYASSRGRSHQRRGRLTARRLVSLPIVSTDLLCVIARIPTARGFVTGAPPPVRQ